MNTFQRALTTPCVIAGILLALTGCATPQPVLDQASNTAALTGALDSELRSFRGVQAIIAKARAESIRRQELEMARIESTTAFQERTQRLAGTSSPFSLMKTLRDLADSRREDDEAFARRMAETDALLAGATTAIPVPSDKLSAAQKALVVLSQELSNEEWLKFLTGFAQAVNTGLKKAREEAEALAKEPKTAPVQKVETKSEGK